MSHEKSEKKLLVLKRAALSDQKKFLGKIPQMIHSLTNNPHLEIFIVSKNE